jgi:hypothetical protein
MKVQFRPAILAATLLLGACTAPMSDGPQTTDPQGGDLPEAVLMIADPNQDLQSAYLRPEDGCYWYRYAGPVETTSLPLRTVDGSPICTRAAS